MILERAAAAQNTAMASFITALDDQRMASPSQYGLAAYLRVWCVHHLTQD